MLSYFNFDILNPSAIKQIWNNYDSELYNSMLQQSSIQYGRTYSSYAYPDVMRLFSRPYCNNTNKELLRTLITASVRIKDMDNLFADQEQVNRLKSVNQNLLKLLIDKGVTKGYQGSDYGSAFSLLALKRIQQHKFDLDQFRTQEQVDRLNSVDLTWLEFLLDRKVIENCHYNYENVVLLSKKEIIDSLNSVNFNLFSALIDGVINQCHSKEYEQLRDYRGGNLVNSDVFYRFLAFLLTKENVQKFNSINSNSLDALMSYATIPKGTRFYYLKNTIDEEEDLREKESSIIWSEFQDTLRIIESFFNTLTKEKIKNLNKLSNANPDLLKLFHDRGIIGDEFLDIFKSETRFDNLNSIDVDSISTLIDSVIDKLNLREAEKLANENLNYGYNPVLRNLSEVFTIFDIKENAEKFNSMDHELINTLVNLATRKAITMRSLQGHYEDEEYDRYYRTKSYLQHTVYLIRKFFPRLAQDTINALNLNLDLLKTLINKSIVEDIQDILRCFKNREQVEMLCNLDLDLVKTLLDKQIIRYNSIVETNAIFVVYNGTRGRESIYRVDREGNRLYTILSLKTIKVLVDKGIIKSHDDIESLYTTISDIQKEVNDLDIIGCGLLKILVNKRFIQNIKDIGELLKKENLITNIQNNPCLTKTILNNDSLINALGTNGVKELICHHKYTENSGCLVRNCQLALALLSKGIIENITIDYLFDSEKIKNDLQGNEFLKNIEFTDASDNVTSSMGEVIDGVFKQSKGNIENNPMPKLKDISLAAFVKNNMPDYHAS